MILRHYKNHNVLLYLSNVTDNWHYKIELAKIYEPPYPYEKILFTKHAIKVSLDSSQPERSSDKAFNKAKDMIDFLENYRLEAIK